VVIAVLAGFTIDFLASRLIKRRARRRLPVVLEPGPEAARPQETAAKAKAAATGAKAPGHGH